MGGHAAAEPGRPPVARRAGEVPARLLDALLGAGVALAISLIVATGDGGARSPAGAYLFAAGFGALMLVRRSRPRTVLVVSVLGVVAYYTLDHPPIGVAVPIAAALFAAADAGLVLWPVAVSAALLAVSTYFRLREGEPLGFLLGYESVSNGALSAAAIALGHSTWARRARTIQQDEITRLSELQAGREAELRIQTERERLSRDLHDTVGHAMSVISLQAHVAAEAIGRDDRVAAEALDRVRTTSAQSLRDLRSMVRILRSGTGDAERSVLSLSAVADLAETARSVGIDVTMDIRADSAQLSPPVDAAAYRVIQESITNVVRHAGARHTHVTAAVHDGVLHVGVVDDGRGCAGPGRPDGHGLAGMAERVRLLGGSLDTRSGATSGFTVEARLPARLEAP